MEQKKIPPKKVKVVVRSSPMFLKVVLTLLIVFSMAALVALRWIHLEFQTQTASLISKAAEIDYSNQQIKERTENIGSVQSIEAIAMEELGLVSPDVVLIDPE